MGDVNAAEYFQSESVSRLIPLLDRACQTGSKSILLPTTVLLRCLEQFSEPGNDIQCHMSGAFSLFTKSRTTWSPSQIDTEGTSFWIAVRQNLRICFLFEQKCCFDLGIIDASGMYDNARDDVWTNRMTYLLAKVCSICWSSDSSRNSIESNLLTLDEELDIWREHLPASFKPWYHKRCPSDAFDEVRYIGRWHSEISLGSPLERADEPRQQLHGRSTTLHAQCLQYMASQNAYCQTIVKQYIISMYLLKSDAFTARADKQFRRGFYRLRA